MYWINYAIKCVIRNIIYKLMKPRNLIIFLVIILIILLLSNYITVFGWEGNNDYTDKNNTIALNYESIVNDFINRFNNLDKNNVNYNNFVTLLENDELSFYLYYGDIDGSSMTGGNYFITSTLNIIFYSKSSPSPSISTHERYNGMTTNMYNLTSSIQDYFYFYNGILYTSSKPSSVVMPGVLISYVSPAWVSYYNNDSQSQTNDIISAINEQTNSINEQTNSINDFANTMTAQDDNEGSSDINDSFNSMTSSTSSQDNNINTIHNFFIDLSNIITGSLNTQTVSISFPVPFTEEEIIIKSDVIYNIIKGTLIYTLLQLAYYTLFGFYIITQVWRILLWFQSGQFINGKFVKTENLLNDMLM